VLSAGVQQDTKPPNIKEEPEGEPLPGRAPAKTEDDEAQSSQLHQTQEEHVGAEPPAGSSAQQVEGGGEDRGGSDPDGLLQPANAEETPGSSSDRADTVRSKRTRKGVSVSQPARDDGTLVSSKSESDDSDSDWEETRKPQSDLRKLTKYGVARGVKERNAAGKKSCRCSKCGKPFKANGGKSSPGIEPWVCSVCVRGSTHSASECLITKKTTRSGETAFACSVCKRQFACKGDAVKHRRIHTGEKPFGCSACGKRFTQSTSLSSHMRTHTGEKPHGCTLCPRRFIRSGVLDRHMRVHTGERPYVCAECNASFSLSHTLMKHLRIHTGEKPFSCAVCDKKFTQKGHLTQHATLHTGEKSFGCRVCGRKFTRRSNMNNHKCVKSKVKLNRNRQEKL